MHLGGAVCICRGARRPAQLAWAQSSDPPRVRPPFVPTSSPVIRLLGLKRKEDDAPGALPRPPSAPHTVYTLRVSSGLRRGSALDDLTAGVVVCLVGADGSAFLHRLHPLADPETRQAELTSVCDSLDDSSDAGANCKLSLSASARQRGGASAGPAKRRFQEGSVDEIVFVGPELGPLAGLLIAPEAGRWVLDEVDVFSSRTGHTDRFVCREALGDGGERPAAYLTPVPPGGVVYGSGEAAVVLSREEAAALHAFHMQQYSELKRQLLSTTALLVALGTGGTAALAGPALALPFALGGTSALLYQFLLAAGVDGIGAGAGGGSTAYAYAATAQQPPPLVPGPELRLKVALSNPAVRLAAAGGGLVTSFGLLHMMSMQDGHPNGQLEFHQILAATAGFLTYKVAILVGSLGRHDDASLLAGSGAAGGQTDRSSAD